MSRTTPDGWTEEQRALRDATAEFVRREVTPHLQDWEDAGEIPRELHLAAAEAGLLGVGFPEAVGGQGGTLLDSVALQEAFFEAGGSSGLAAGLFTGGIALPHLAAHGTPDQVDALGPARPSPARRSARSRSPSPEAGPTSPASAPPRSGTATTSSSTAPRPTSPAGYGPTS